MYWERVPEKSCAMENKKTMFTKEELFQAILSRHSTRRFKNETPSPSALQQVEGFLQDVKPLCPENHFECLLRPTQGENLAEIMGAYGRIVNPPCYLVPYLQGGTHPLTDLGYRAEQIVIRLTAAGWATCYLGTLNRQENVCRKLNLPEAAHIGALLLFGQPTRGIAGRAVNQLIHNMAGAQNRLPVEQLFFNESFTNPSQPPSDIADIIQAARSAPSAVNTQPWRFLLKKHLYLFVVRHNPRYKAENQLYRYYDAGICMANISMAWQRTENPPAWQLLDEKASDLPEHPAELEAIAKLEI